MSKAPWPVPRGPPHRRWGESGGKDARNIYKTIDYKRYIIIKNEITKETRYT